MPTVNPSAVTETVLTRQVRGHLLANTGVWSADSEWIVYDTRSDPAGERFDGATLERVHFATGEVQTLYTATCGALCGVVTCHPRDSKVVFILGPESPTSDWSYNAWHRQGAIVDMTRPGEATMLDARDLVPPFTPGALRGGSHLHVWDAAGEWISFTYEDHLLAQFPEATPDRDANLRNVGVSVPGRPVRVGRGHPRNHDGTAFSVLVTRTTATPRAGSDEIRRACEEAWVGERGYRRADGAWQHRALAFQGQVRIAAGEFISEVFLVDLPDDVTVPGDGPLAGTATRLPSPPRGVCPRRLTFTADRKHPGLQGPRHWLRSSPDGARIAFLMRDDDGVVQLWTVSPNGGAPVQVTRNPWPIASAFTWSPDGRWIAHVMDQSVCVTDLADGRTIRLTPRSDAATAPRPEACVFSPDGRKLAFVRRQVLGEAAFNQIHLLCWPEPLSIVE